MNRRELFGIFLLSFYIAFASGQECLANCTGHASNDKVPDPNNCTQYYVCLPGQVPSDDPFSCSVGEEFDPVLGNCTAPYGCKPTCAGSGCHMTCYNVDEYIADPVNCSLFYVCDINGPGAAEACPGSSPFYNPVSGICTQDSSVCCKPSCIPFCEELSIQVPDPKNCSQYYQCNSGPVYPPKACPAGEVFNIGTGRCDPTAKCVEWCSQTGPTTTLSPPSNCIQPSDTTCSNSGFFSVCNTFCIHEYYFCEAAGTTPILQTCTADLLFNPVPEWPYCVLSSNCPYYPP
ncbi:hypothetical protein SK128_005376 [Halocaridina rubra]|uniref:Chitin-binding type-2 domain-containing protein n=1 Tax=Halocaridina rubra TaxID=373956 RepID=A0AAN8XUS0_HALRR